ncbi:MAG: hypothetical protein ABJN62_13610, partial [Halioglobus sp.]
AIKSGEQAMSSAYIYGGLDRSCPSWTGQVAGSEGVDPESLSGNDNPARSTHTAFVYGGIDRNPVEWHSETVPADFSTE